MEDQFTRPNLPDLEKKSMTGANADDGPGPFNQKRTRT
jgi:hypothetical protein